MKTYIKHRNAQSSITQDDLKVEQPMFPSEGGRINKAPSIHTANATDTARFHLYKTCRAGESAWTYSEAEKPAGIGSLG